MDSSHYQIHIDRVIPKSNIKLDYLLCQICTNVLWQPEKCNSCHTHYCRFCIVFSLLKNKKCPTCSEVYAPKSPDTFLIEDLQDLSVKCYYTTNGCNKILNYSAITKHESECIYREQNCEECNKKILKKNYHTHIVLCKNSFPEELGIDYRQILVYFSDKLQRIERENSDDLEKLKKNFMENYHNKELILANLFKKFQKQKKMLEEVVIENEKRKNQSEEEIKIFNEYGNVGNTLNKEIINSNYNSNNSGTNSNIYSSSSYNTRNSNLVHTRIIQ